MRSIFRLPPSVFTLPKWGRKLLEDGRGKTEEGRPKKFDAINPYPSIAFMRSIFRLPPSVFTLPKWGRKLLEDGRGKSEDRRSLPSNAHFLSSLSPTYLPPSVLRLHSSKMGTLGIVSLTQTMSVSAETPISNLRDRTKAFALRIVRLYTSLPKSTEAQVLGQQMLRSGTSVGAHYREAIRARSNAEYISKIEGGLQELEETVYWIELLIDAQIVNGQNLQNLLNEADELTAVLVSCVKKARNK